MRLRNKIYIYSEIKNSELLAAFEFRIFISPLPVCVFYLFKPVSVQAYYKPIGFEEVEAPTFLDSWLMNVVKVVSSVHWLP
jgi:hypothetical protein